MLLRLSYLGSVGGSEGGRREGDKKEESFADPAESAKGGKKKEGGGELAAPAGGRASQELTGQASQLDEGKKVSGEGKREGGATGGKERENRSDFFFYLLIFFSFSRLGGRTPRVSLSFSSSRQPTFFFLSSFFCGFRAGGQHASSLSSLFRIRGMCCTTNCFLLILPPSPLIFRLQISLKNATQALLSSLSAVSGESLPPSFLSLFSIV